MSDAAPAVITNLPPEAAAEFLNACPTARRVTLGESHWGTRWGIAVTFDDGARQAVRKWCFTKPERDAFIRQAGPILFAWHQKRKGA